MEVDGIQNNSPGDKTKIMSMYDGNGDITTSDYRATIEKRDAGVVAWRFIAGETDSEAQIETIGNERVGINFNPSQTYLWRSSWGNHFFRVEIFEGPTTANRIYEFGKGYEGTYDPTPHVAFIGSPIGRGGPGDASVVGATWRNVYLGSIGRPRPTSLGTALIEDPEPGSARQEPRHPRHQLARARSQRRSKRRLPRGGRRFFIRNSFGAGPAASPGCRWPIDPRPHALEDGALARHQLPRSANGRRGG